MQFLVKYPSRARPDQFFVTLRAYLRDPIVRVLVTADEDDETMNSPAIRSILDKMDRVTVRWGHSKSKVEAINDGVAEAEWDLLMLGSDDMVPQRPDYATRIVQLFEERFPLGDGVLHLNDGRVGKVLNTLAICDRKFFDRFGYVYAPCYTSLYCDQEFQDVSELLGRASYSDEIIVRHEWVGEHCPDDLLRRNESFYQSDGRIFEHRKRQGFPPITVTTHG